MFRLVHIDNLPLLLRRGGLHAPNHTPTDDLVYRTIHDTSVQTNRRVARISCGPGGTVHDYVFSDGHGLAALTAWYDSLESLIEVDWAVVGQQYWTDTPEDPDRQRRKQAEFLVHEFLPWELLAGVAVIDEEMKARVEAILEAHGRRGTIPVRVRRKFYYP